MSIGKKFAVFDIDGTVARWQFLHAINDQLAQDGYISADQYQPVRDARMTWKKRDHSKSFQEYEKALVKVWEKTLPRLTTTELADVVDKVFDHYKDQTYTYTRNLIRELKAKNYLMLIISGAPSEIVTKFAEYYGFDDYIGTEHPHKNGKYTGEILLRIHDKHETMQQLIAKHNLSMRGSIGVGDTGGDIGFLEAVEQPIAFNPDGKLFEHAKAQGWKIVVERKSVIYELDAKNGQFVLA